MFPAVKGGYIDQHNFQTRIFKPIVKALYTAGKISKVLSTYHLRHSFATRLIREGMDIAAIAGLIGDDIKTVITYYISVSVENTEVPEL